MVRGGWCLCPPMRRTAVIITALAGLLIGTVPMTAADWVEKAQAGRTLFQQSNWEAAGKEFQAALAQAEAAGASPSDTAELVHAIGCTEYNLGRFRSAKEYFIRSAAAAERGSSLHLRSLNNVAKVCRYLGELKLAEATTMRILEANPDSAVGWLQLGQIRFERREFAEAEKATRRALELSAGSDPAIEHAALNDLATIHFERRELADAEKLLLRSLGQSQGAYARANIRTNLAKLYWATGRRDEALLNYETALKEAESSVGPSHPETGILLAEYSFMLKKAGRKQESRALEKRAESIRSAFAYQANTTGASIDWRDIK